MIRGVMRWDVAYRVEMDCLSLPFSSHLCLNSGDGNLGSRRWEVRDGRDVKIIHTEEGRSFSLHRIYKVNENS